MTFWIQRPRMRAIHGMTHRMFMLNGEWWWFQFKSCSRHDLQDRRHCRWWKPWVQGKVWKVWKVESHCQRAVGGPTARILDNGAWAELQMYQTTTLGEIIDAMKEDQ